MRCELWEKFSPWLAAGLGVLSFAGTFPTTRWLLDSFSPWEIGSGRAVVAGVLALAVLALANRPLPPRSLWLRLWIGSLGVAFAFPVLSAWALLDVEGSSAAVLAGALPLTTAVLATVFAGERPSTQFWWACTFGCAAVIGYALWSSEWGWRWGNTLFFGAMLCASAGYVAGGSAARTLPAWEVACWLTIPVLPLNLVLLAFGPWDTSSTVSSAPPTGFAWLGFAQLVLFSQLLGFVFWNYALARRGIARVSQFQLLQPFVTLALAALWLGERISPVMIVAVAAVAISLVWARSNPSAIRPPSIKEARP